MLLGIDLGTGSTKALLLSSTGEVLGEGSAAYPVNAPQPGWAETAPMDWWQAVAIAVRKATQGKPSKVEAIACQDRCMAWCCAMGMEVRSTLRFSGQILVPVMFWRRIIGYPRSSPVNRW